MDDWISVKDRLPEPAYGWTCSDDIIIGNALSVRTGYMNGSKDFYAYRHFDRNCLTEAFDATHWMPCPLAPICK